MNLQVLDAEECVQVLGQFCRWKMVVLGVVFLLEDEAIEILGPCLNGWLIKLLSENSSIEVGITLDKPGPSPELPGNDHQLATGEACITNPFGCSTPFGIREISTKRR